MEFLEVWRLNHQESPRRWKDSSTGTQCVSWWGLNFLEELQALFFLGETYVECIQLANGLNYVVDVRVRLLKGPVKGPTKRPKACRDTSLAVSIDGPNDG